MKFVDQAKIYVTSGHGGAGCVSFRREKYLPKGGPDGGDGGRGGDVVLLASSQKDTLFRFHLNQHFRAGNGRPGSGRNRDGPQGPSRLVTVPLGTVVFDAETGEELADLCRPGARYLAAKGGRGGQGNARFATPSRRTPRFAQPGEPGESRRLLLELRLLADAGLVGLPNVGKSTLISRLSAAKPKIAPYPFTTLVPGLGAVEVDAEHSFVIADLPGLIAGAAQGAGLGHRFLRHVRRCRVLVHMLDPLRVSEDDPLADLRTINAELAAFDPELPAKPQLVVVGKMDLAEGAPALAAVRRALAAAGDDRRILGLSAAAGQGLNELKFAVWDILSQNAPSWENCGRNGEDPAGPAARPDEPAPEGPAGE